MGAPGTPGTSAYYDSPTKDASLMVQAWLRCECGCVDDKLLDSETIYIEYKTAPELNLLDKIGL